MKTNKYIYFIALLSLALGIMFSAFSIGIVPDVDISYNSSLDTQTFQNDNELKDQTFQTHESGTMSGDENTSPEMSTSISKNTSQSISKVIPNASSKPQTRVSTAKATPVPHRTSKSVSSAIRLATAGVTSIALDKMLGCTKEQIILKYGQPVAYEQSEYGFTWYIYHSAFKRYFMVGIKAGLVVGAYSNSTDLFFANMPVIKSRGNVRKTILSKYGTPFTSIQKGNLRYIISNLDQRDVFCNGKNYMTVFYDNLNGGVLTSVMIIDKATEQSFGIFPAPSDDLDSSFEMVSFYLVNSIRVRSGLKALSIDARLQKLAKDHSVDMLNRSYFSHTNPEGQSSSDRLRNAGISFSKCSENISKNYQNSILSHEGYMNSPGHRKNILSDCKYIGVGVEIASGKILQTQIFIA